MPLLKEALKSPRLVRGRSCSLCAGRQVKGAVGKTRHAATGHIRRRRTCPECGRSYFTVELRLPDAAKAAPPSRPCRPTC